MKPFQKHFNVKKKVRNQGVFFLAYLIWPQCIRITSVILTNYFTVKKQRKFKTKSKQQSSNLKKRIQPQTCVLILCPLNIAQSMVCQQSKLRQARYHNYNFPPIYLIFLWNEFPTSSKPRQLCFTIHSTAGSTAIYSNGDTK